MRENQNKAERSHFSKERRNGRTEKHFCREKSYKDFQEDLEAGAAPAGNGSAGEGERTAGECEFPYRCLRGFVYHVRHYADEGKREGPLTGGGEADFSI